MRHTTNCALLLIVALGANCSNRQGGVGFLSHRWSDVAVTVSPPFPLARSPSGAFVPTRGGKNCGFPGQDSSGTEESVSARSSASHQTLVFREDFSHGADRWQTRPSSQWQVAIGAGDTTFCLTVPGVPGPVRAPMSWAVVKNLDLHGFLLEGRFLCLAPVEVRNRDLDVFFNFQDSLHFCYVHFSAHSDQVHNIIGLVNGADRAKINREPAGASEARLTDQKWHRFRVSYEATNGEVQAFLDDFTKPILTAVDTVLGHGTVGVGSFDDTGCFDDIRVWGQEQE